MTEKSITFADLFSGIGGFHIGLDKAGMKCSWACEKNELVSGFYEDNFGINSHQDVKEVNAKDVPDHNVLAAGFPCQPFSIGGHRKGFDDERGTLFFDILRIVKEKKPEALLLENVPGLLSMNDGKTIETIENKLKAQGYSVGCKVHLAQHFGLPQTRKRLFIVAFHEDTGIKVDSGKNKSLKQYENSSLLFNFPERNQKVSNLKEFLESNVKDHDITETAEKHADKYVAELKDNGEYNSDKPIILSEIRPSRCTVRNDGTVPTLTARMGTGGNNIPVLYDRKRKLTVREVLRLQGFPDWFEIRENYYKSYKAVGNSVPVNIVEELGTQIKDLLVNCSATVQ
jgi:DNA (cytosine-5)-methyltransferase 1